MSPIVARAATSCGDPWYPLPARRIPDLPTAAPRPANASLQNDFVTLAYTVRRAPNCGAPTPMPVPSRSS